MYGWSSEYPRRGLDGAPAVWHLGLAEIVSQRLVDEPLAVATRVVARLIAEEQRFGIEASKEGGDARELVSETVLEPRCAQPLAHRGAGGTRALRLERHLRVVARVHLREQKMEQFSPYVDPTLGHELTAPTNGQRSHYVDRHQPHTRHGDLRARRNLFHVRCNRVRPDRAGTTHILVRRVPSSDYHVVHNDRVGVGQAHLLTSVAPADRIDGRRLMMHDVHIWRRAGQKRAIEPPEVLAHQTARQEVMGLDRLARRIYRTLVPDPPVARRCCPVVQAEPVAGLMRLRLKRVQGELPTGVVEE